MHLHCCIRMWFFHMCMMADHILTRITAVFITTIIIIMCTSCAGSSSVSNITRPSRILVLMPFNSRSHKNFHVPLISALASRGHYIKFISMLSPNEQLSDFPNVNEIIIPLDANSSYLIQNIGDNVFRKPSSSFLSFVYSLQDSAQFCEYLLSKPEVKNLMLSKEKFDVILLDAFTPCTCFIVFSEIFQAPLIEVAPSQLMPWNYGALGTPLTYSQDAVFFLPHTDRKNFWERMESVVLGLSVHLAYDWVYFPWTDQAVRTAVTKVLGPERAAALPAMWDVERTRISLILVNWHWSLMGGAFVRPNPPTVVEVAGLHCRPARPLPQDLENFVAGAGEHGFIYFSFGSMVPGKKLPKNIRDTFIAVFSSLHQRVLWKFEESITNLPANVMVRSWLPQQDLLGDPRLRVFITQAGMLSIQEAVYHGAPVLAFPLIVDQSMNAALIKEKGLGLHLNIHTTTPSQLQKSLHQLLTNPIYRDNSRRLSALMWDQPESPSSRAVWWVEYVIRHQGAYHLRPPSAALSWPQYYLVDVFLSLALLLVVLPVTGVSVIYFLCRRARQQTKPKKD